MVQDIPGANDQDPSTIGRASQSVPSVRTPNAKSAGLAIPMALNVIAWDPIFVNVNVLSASDPDRTAPKTPTGGVILSPSMAKTGTYRAGCAHTDEPERRSRCDHCGR